MSSTPLPLPVSDIVTVNVSVAAPAVAPRSFNQGLIVGPSTHIPSYGANPRIREYPSLAAMVADGFMTTDPEYLAAQLYFSQTPAPQEVWIGRQDLTAIKTIIPHAGNAGTGYAVGDVVGVTQGGGSHGFATVLTTNAGVVLSLGTTIGNQGTGYSDGTALATTGGTGTGLEVDITAIGESYLQAVEACFAVNNDWYPFMCCNAVDADHLALAAYSTANWENLLYFGSSADATIPAGTAANVALQMQAANYKALLSYNTTQSGEFPNNAYAAAAIMGLACGLNTGQPGSAFTLNLKQLTGVAPEPLTQTQFTAITAADCNTCATFGAFSGYVFNGILSSGDYFDQILDRATFVNLIQTNLMNLLTSVPKIPQTDAGEHQLISQVDAAAAAMVELGWFAPGVWEGATIMFGQNVFIANGQSLPEGFLDGAPPFSSQSSGDRAARKAMPITSVILESGAVDSVVVNVNVQL